MNSLVDAFLSLFPDLEDAYTDYELSESLKESPHKSVVKAYKKSTEQWVVIKRYQVQEIMQERDGMLKVIQEVKGVVRHMLLGVK